MAIGKMVSLAVAGPGRLELEWDDGHGAAVDLGAVIWKLMSDGGYAHSAELLQALPPDAAASAQALRERFA